MAINNPPALPQDNFLYVANPYTDGLLNDNAAIQSLVCYAKAQGYNALIMYEMGNWVVGNQLTEQAAWSAFINYCNTYGIYVFAAFGGTDTALPVIYYSATAGNAPFSGLVSEIEWWNWSHNLPFQQPVTGNYSFVYALKIFAEIKKTAITYGVNMTIIPYLGWTKARDEVYTGTFPVTVFDSVTNEFEVKGELWTGGGGEGLFDSGEKIQVVNYPTAGVTTQFTTTQVYNYFGNTRFKVTGSVTPPVITPGQEPYIANSFEVVAQGSFNPFNYYLYVKGDKRRFIYDSTYSRFIAKKINVTQPTGGGSGIYIIPGGVPLVPTPQNIPTYDPVTNRTRLLYYFSGKTAISTGSFVSFDVVGDCYDWESVYGITGWLTADAGELLQLDSTVDAYALHVYVTGVPRYNYAQSRIQQIATDAVNTWNSTGNSRYNPSIGPWYKAFYFIIASSTGSSYSSYFLQGKDTNGNLIYQPKNIIAAYKYLTQNTTGVYTPAQITPYAAQETNGNVIAYPNLNINGIIMFSDKRVRPLVIGNGPDILIYEYPADYFSINTVLPYTETFDFSYCDDCLPPGATYYLTFTCPDPTVTVINPTQTNTACDGHVSFSVTYTSGGYFGFTFAVQDGTTGQSIQKTKVIAREIVPLVVVLDVKFITKGITLPCPDTTMSGTSQFSITGTYVAPIYYNIYDSNGVLVYNNDTGPQSGPVFIMDSFPVNPYTDTYTVNFTDDAGATGSATIQVTVPDYVKVLETINQPCKCGDPASIYIDVSGGAQPYTYEWDGNPFLNQPYLTGGYATCGDHTVAITDANGCKVTQIYTIDPGKPFSVKYTITNPLCFGNADGSIIADVYGGEFPYTYVWNFNPLLDTPFVTGLPAGTYQLTVIDSRGCENVFPPVTLASIYPAISFEIDGPLIVCNTVKFVEFQAINAVGSAPYVFVWDNGQIGEFANYDFQGNRPGIYTITCTMTDDNGCVFSTSYDIQVTTWQYTPNIVVSGGPLTTCAGSSIDIEVVNPQGDGEWAIPGNPTTPSITIDNAWWQTYAQGLSSYTFTWNAVDPVSKCEVSASVKVEAPQTIKLEVVYIAPNPCGGPGNQGEIEIQVINGCPPFIFSWIGPNGYTSSSQNISSLVNGDYFVTVQDSNTPTPNQTSLGPITVSTSIPVITGVVTSAGCRPSSNGTITTSVTGGTAPYYYKWNDNVKSENRSNLGPGLYTLTVTDDNGCEGQASFTITNDPGISAIVNGSGPSAAGTNDGWATAVPSGGTAPYTYLWSNGETTQQITGLDYGSYTVLVTSSGGCTGFATIVFTPSTINHPPVDPCVIDRLKCCASSISYQYVKQRKNGLWDKAQCTMANLMLIIGYIHDLESYMENGCLSVDEVRSIAEKANQICGCCGCSQNPYDDTL